MSKPWPMLDRDEFIDDVIEMLQKKHGIEPGIVERRVKAAASELLSAFSVTPGLRQEVALDLDGSLHYDKRMHGD